MQTQTKLSLNEKMARTAKNLLRRSKQIRQKLDESFISQTAAEISGSYTLYNTFSLQGYEQTERHVTLRFPKR